MFSLFNNLRRNAGWSRSEGSYYPGMKASRLELIGSAAAGIAHDINNELNLIVNHLALSDVDSAREAAKRCSAMTGSLLSYCKGDSIALSTTEPGYFLMKFVAQLDLPKGIDIRLQMPPALPPIAVNPLALTRALTNLVVNARDAMEDVGIITFSAGENVIAVSDTGPGIPEEIQGRIFEPFFTTKNAGGKKAKGGRGTGLGLVIVRELMRQQGGSVSVESAPGQGAAFMLRFRPAAGAVA